MFRAVDDDNYTNNFWGGQYMNSYQVFYGDKSIEEFDESVYNVISKNILPNATVKVGDPNPDSILDAWNKQMATPHYDQKNQGCKTNNNGIFLTNPDDSCSSRSSTDYPYSMSAIEAAYTADLSKVDSTALLIAMKEDGANYIMTDAIKYGSSSSRKK